MFVTFMTKALAPILRSLMIHRRWHLTILVGLLVLSQMWVFPSPQPPHPNTTRSDARSLKNEITILVFSKTLGYRHDSIPDAIAAITDLGAQRGLLIEATEDAGVFNDESLARYHAVVFLMTTGDVLDKEQQASFERYIQSDKGFVGIHSASDTEYDWPWYGELIGAYFNDHPKIQTATILIEDGTHPSTIHLPQAWERTDEWYNFSSNPRDRKTVRVLATVDEMTYSGGTMGDHPIVWCQEYDGGRSWYTAGGHTRESYQDELFMAHIIGGIEYAAGIQF